MIDIRSLTRYDWPAVSAIYQEGVEDGDATFETVVPGWAAFDAGKLPAPRLVATDGDRVVGWIAASLVSARPAYAGVIEHSVYVARSARGNGIGRLLLAGFVHRTDNLGYWTIQSSIFPENAGSLRLHETAGFRRVGTRERIARSVIGPRAGQWRDTVLIERRSSAGGHA